MSKSRNYREIDVKKQHSMSLAETFSLCVKGVRHRLLRSMLTLAVVVLAVAFFMFLLSESMFIRSTGHGVEGEGAHQRASQQLLNNILSPATDLATVRRLADANRQGDSVVIEECARITGMPMDDLKRLAATAAKERKYTDWLASIPTGNRTVLVHKHSGRRALEYILNDTEGFTRKLEPMLDIKVPDGRDSFMEFLSGYGAYASEISTLTEKWNTKVKQANELTKTAKGDDNLGETKWIMTAQPEASEAWRKQIEELGFAFDLKGLELMREQFSAVEKSDEVFRELNTSDVRTAWAREFSEARPSTAEQKAVRLDDRRAHKILGAKFTPETLDAVAAKTKYDKTLSELERKLAPSLATEASVLGLSSRQFFLLVISFVVCMVGIANAMLMSITERFREIATMKCLGATDTYILVQFMMEAGMQGFFGGILGVFMGFVIAALRSWANFGAHLFAYWPWSDIMLSAAVSLFAGVLLAMMASIVPSWIASRMAPMDAMRVE